MRYDIEELSSLPSNPGRVVLLLGTSVSGPINTPLYVRNIQTAEGVFGPKDRGDLVKAYEEASLNSDITICLMRVTGEYARGSLIGNIDGTEQPVLKFRSIYGGEGYNSISYRVRDVTDNSGNVLKAFVMESPTGLNIAFPLSEFDNLDQLVTAINVSTKQGEAAVFASTDFPTAASDCLLGLNDEERFLLGGEDGLDITKDDLYLALNTAYELLEGFECDIVHPVSARFNDTYPAFFYGQDATYGKAVYGNYAKGDFLQLVDTQRSNQPVTFHEQLITFCRSQQQSGIFTHGVLGLREVSDTSVYTRFERSYLLRLLDTAAFMTRYGLIEQVFDQVIDKGHYISVFGSEFIFNQGTENEYYRNGAAVYAGMLASTAPDSTTTNSPLPPGIVLRHEFTTAEMRELAIIGVTVARNSIRKGLVVVNGVTASLYESDLHYVGNVRMIQYALRAVNAAVDDLIGEPFSESVLGKELHRRMTNTINSLKETGVLREANFEIEFSRQTQTGQVKLELMAKHSVEFILADAMMRFSGRG